jgi:hypothetical protein
MTNVKIMRANLGAIGSLPKNDTTKSPLQTAIELRRKNKATLLLTDDKSVPFNKPIAPTFGDKDITE